MRTFQCSTVTNEDGFFGFFFFGTLTGQDIRQERY
jgi:hypothetical protein